MARNRFAVPGGTRLSPAAKRLIGGKGQRVRIFKQYPFPVNMAIDGIEEQKQYLEEIGNYLQNEGATTLLRAAVQGTGEVLAKSFASQGKYGGVKWPPITEGTKAQREKMGYSPDAPPLVRSGALQRAISEFVGAYGKRTTNSVDINESFTGIIHPNKPTRRLTGKGAGDTDKDTVFVNVKQTSTGKRSGKVSVKAVLKISGDSVANNTGYTAKVWSVEKNKLESVKVPARPFWFINARTVAIARKHVREAIYGPQGMSETTFKEIAPKKYALGTRGYWRNRAQEQFNAQELLKLPANATKEQRIQFISNLVEKKMAKHGGEDMARRMWRPRYQRELAENPWYWTDVQGQISMGGVVASLRHMSGPRMSQVYRFGPRDTHGRMPKGLEGRARWDAVGTPSGKVYIRYKYKKAGEKGAAKWYEADVTSLGEIKVYLRRSQEAGATFEDYDAFVAQKARQILSKVKTEAQAKKAGFEVLIKTIEIESAARGGTYEGQRIKSSRYRRKVIAQSFRSDFNAEGLRRAMTATSLSEGDYRTTERLDQALRVGVTAGRKPGPRELSPTDVAILLRGRLQEEKALFKKRHGVGTYEKTIGSLSTKRNIEISDLRGNKFMVSEAELALFAPQGYATVSDLTGLFTRSRGEVSQWALRQNLARQALQSVIPGEQAAVERVLQDYFGHSTGEHVRTGRGAYATLVGERFAGNFSRRGQKATSAVIDAAVWTDIQKEAFNIRIRERTLRMMEERINAAWAEGLMQDREAQIRRYLGINESSQALQILPNKDLLQEALSFIAQDERKMEEKLSIELGYDVILPRYNTAWRQRGWGVDYGTIDQVLGLDVPGYHLTDRPLIAQPNRTFRKIGAGEALIKGNIADARQAMTEAVSDTPQVKSVNRQVTMWVNSQGRIGITKEKALEIGPLTHGDPSPEFQAFRDIQTMWSIGVSGELIRLADAKLRVNAEDIFRQQDGTWWIKGTKKGETPGWAGYLRGNTRGKITDYVTKEEKVSRVDPFTVWMAQPIHQGEGDLFILDPRESVFGDEIQKRAAAQVRRQYFEAIVELQQQHPEIFTSLKPGDFQQIIGYRQAQYYARTLANQRQIIDELKTRRNKLTRLERYALTNAERKARLKAAQKAKRP